MSDVVVTLPKSFRWTGAPGASALDAWLAEGDAAGEPSTGQLYEFTIGGRPAIIPGERVYVVHRGRLIGYAPLVDLASYGPERTGLLRGGNANKITIAREIPGFRGFRYRWWDRSEEVAFMDYETLFKAASKFPPPSTGFGGTPR